MSDNPSEGPEPLGLQRAAEMVGQLPLDKVDVDAEAPPETVEAEEAETETEDAAPDTEAQDDSDAEELEAASEEEDEGDETVESDEEQEEAADEPEYQVTVDGQTHKVPLSELLNGYQRQSDYTRKTQEVANVRKEVETAKQQLAQTRDQYEQNLEVVAKFLETAAPYDKDTLDQLARENPDQFAIAEYQNRQHREKLEAVQRELQNTRQQAQAEQQQAFAQQVQQAQSALPQLIPEWRDEKVQKAEATELTNYLREQGVPDEEIRTIISPLAISLARKAMLYDKGTRAKASASEKKAKPKPTKAVKPGASKSPTHQKVKRTNDLRQQLKKPGGSREQRLQTAAKLLMQ